MRTLIRDNFRAGADRLVGYVNHEMLENAMFALLAFAFVFIAPHEIPPSANDFRGCMTLETRWGEQCGERDSFQVIATNTCGSAAYIKICVERTNGKWDCGTDSNLPPGGRNTGWYVCHGTGRYKWASCSAGDDCSFPQPTP